MRAPALLLALLWVALASGPARAEHPGPGDSFKHPGGPPAPQADAQAPSKPRSGWAALPVAVYAPETRLGVGAFASHFFRLGSAGAQTRPSSMSLVGLYTLRDQIIVEAIPELYWDDEEWHLWSRIDYRNYPNRLWAVGNRAPDGSEERYQEDRPRWQFRLGYAVVGKLYVYGHLEALHMGIQNVEPGGLIDRGELPGSGGGRAVGIGPGIAWDTRDHLLVPRSGFFHEAVVMSYQPAFGSEYRFNVLRVNLRRYIGITDEHVLALQYYAEIQQGEPPFYMLAQLGGQRLLRGYFEGRFRDETLMAVQAEYRLPLFWRLGAVGHAAIGDVAASVPAFGLSRPEWSVGAGLRIMLNRAEKLNLRADLGFGYDTWGFYVGVAETF